MLKPHSSELNSRRPISPIADNVPQMKTEFGDLNYLNAKNGTHRAIDLFVPPGTPVLAPESGRLCYRNTDPTRPGLGDIALLGDSGRLYYLLHLDHDTLHSSLNNTYGVNNIPKTNVVQGEQIGQVGAWSNRVHPKLKEKVAGVGSTGSHLHVAVFELDKPMDIDNVLDEFPFITVDKYAVDPSIFIDFKGEVVKPLPLEEYISAK